jgi:hypothetical protein
MLAAISEKARSDARLTALLSRAGEYAEIYLLAKRRQKGCDGMGEVATLKEEFRVIVDEIIGYCKGENDLPRDFAYDIDLLANKLARH